MSSSRYRPFWMGRQEQHRIEIGVLAIIVVPVIEAADRLYRTLYSLGRVSLQRWH